MHHMPDYSGPEMDTQNVIPMLKRLYKTECHIFERQNHHILFNVSSGNFFEIDQVQFDMLSQCDGHTLNEILDILQDRHPEKQVLSAFKELLDAGIVTDTPPEQSPNFSLPNQLEIVHFDLSITTDTLSGSQESVVYMDEQVAFQALALLLRESCRFITTNSIPINRKNKKVLEITPKHLKKQKFIPCNINIITNTIFDRK